MFVAPGRTTPAPMLPTFQHDSARCGARGIQESERVTRTRRWRRLRGGGSVTDLCAFNLRGGACGEVPSRWGDQERSPPYRARVPRHASSFALGSASPDAVVGADLDRELQTALPDATASAHGSCLFDLGPRQFAFAGEEDVRVSVEAVRILAPVRHPSPRVVGF